MIQPSIISGCALAGRTGTGMLLTRLFVLREWWELEARNPTRCRAGGKKLPYTVVQREQEEVGKKKLRMMVGATAAETLPESALQPSNSALTSRRSASNSN